MASRIPFLKEGSGESSSSFVLIPPYTTVREETLSNIQLLTRIAQIEERVEDVYASIASLGSRIGEVEVRLASLTERLSGAGTEEKVIILRELTKEEATEEIRNLFRKGETLYYSDIAEKLGLDLEQVVEICNELVGKGEIGAVK